MNNHLNIFRTYSKENRRYQLENDLTRALAISLQENILLLNEVLNSILDEEYSNEMFSDLYSSNVISIYIQKASSEITGFEKIFAVSLSERTMDVAHFWNQKPTKDYDPVCDIVIYINKVVVIIETKRDNVDCTAQLYNQIYNICKKNDQEIQEYENKIFPKDLNWPKLMNLAVRIHSLEIAAGRPSRFLSDFINLVKGHNFKWIPEPSISSVSADNIVMIERRIDSALNSVEKQHNRKKLEYNNRFGLVFYQKWAQEILFSIGKDGALICTVYAGNTKAQGKELFQKQLKPRKSLLLHEKEYDVAVLLHVKFTSFQSYFTGLSFSEKHLTEELYTRDNFNNYCGRNIRGEDWDKIRDLFNRTFKETYHWMDECEWYTKIINSGRSRFDMSFGYELSISIPFEELRRIDKSKNDLTGLTALIEGIYLAFSDIYS